MENSSATSERQLPQDYQDYPKVYKYYSTGTEFNTFHERVSPKANDGPAMRTDKRGKKHKGIVAEKLKVLSKTRRCKVLSHVS